MTFRSAVQQNNSKVLRKEIGVLIKIFHTILSFLSLVEPIFVYDVSSFLASDFSLVALCYFLQEREFKTLFAGQVL